jgi:predicted ATPase
VVDWLSYLGVAEGIATVDLGKMGHQLQVRTGDTPKDQDLTNVGVGVSQLLPIIVMALLSPTPSLLIFEQPELHLHPKVQARLADFFLSLGFSDRQCLLETHSEYLVDRLRLRIAESSGDTISSKINIYFTEKTGGRTVCRPVELTEYGAVRNWPADFFDQTQNEVERILRAAQEKRIGDRQRATLASTK